VGEDNQVSLLCNGKVNSSERKFLRLVVEYRGREVPTNGAMEIGDGFTLMNIGT